MCANRPGNGRMMLDISINAKTEEDRKMAEIVLAAIRALPAYTDDRAELDKDTRRGGFSFRYETFTFQTAEEP